MEKANQVLAELERLNLSPIIDGNKIVFTYQGVRYMFCNFGMENYIFFTTHIADAESELLTETLKAMNTVNILIHFGKLTLQDGRVLASYEYLMPDDAKMEYVILNAFSTLSYARDKFYSELAGAKAKFK